LASCGDPRSRLDRQVEVKLLHEELLIGIEFRVADTTTNTVVPPPILVLGLGGGGGIAVTPDGSKVYLANNSHYICGGGLNVISTVSNTVIKDIQPGSCFLRGVAVSPDGSRVYVAGNFFPPPSALGAVWVIDTATDTVITSVTVGFNPFGVAVSPEGSKVYVTNYYGFSQPPVDIVVGGSVSVIDTATNTVVDAIPFGGSRPLGLAVTPDGSKLYVAEASSNAVSVIDTTTNTALVPPIPVGQNPVAVAFGQFLAGETRDREFSRAERLGAGPAVWKSQSRGCHLGLCKRQGFARHHQGVL
jgi:YVTN family beta-propeller protein